ncbi:Ribosomal protein L22/L17 [Phytophthora cactorum]|nr:Ribosomal protein L22/L17 [Phytophthora cactorum]
MTWPRWRQRRVRSSAAGAQAHEDGAESDKARTDSDDEDEELPIKQHEEVVAPVQEPTTPVEAPKTPVEEPTTPTEAYPKPTTPSPTTPVEAHAEPTTPVEQPPEQTFGEDVVEKELIVQEKVTESPPSPSSPTAEPVGIDEVEKLQVQVHEVELKVQEENIQGHEVELVIPSPKRPAPLNLVHHDIDDEASDSDEMEGAAGGEDDEEGADLGTPLGYGGAADFGEGQDEFTSHRFLGPSVASDASSVRALHSLRRVALHDNPPRFVSESSVVAASSGSVTSSGESSGRNSSSASAIHAPDSKSGLRSQSEVDFVEHPLNAYTLTFTEPVLGFNTNVVVSLENELLVELSGAWRRTVLHNVVVWSECYDLGTHGMENTEQMQALSEAIVQYKLQKKCKQFTPEFLLSLRRDICKGRPDKFEYLGSGLLILLSNDIEVNIEWLPDEADQINAAGRPSVDRMSAGAFGSGDEEEHDGPTENLEKLRIWISDKKTRTTSPFATADPGLSANEAILQMKFSPKRKAEIFQKTVQNAINLADIKYQIEPENLMVAECFVNKGTFLKRLRIMGRGAQPVDYIETLRCDAPPAHPSDCGAARVRPFKKPLNRHLTKKLARENAKKQLEKEATADE